MSAPIITTAPATYKQPSRKGKKAWRKNVNLEDIHEGLEKAREEIRITGGIISEKSNGDLFTVDLAGSSAIKESHFKTAKVLKVDEILSQRSAIPAVSSRKRSAFELEQQPMVTDGIIPKKKKYKKDGISFRELQRLKNIINGKGSGVEGEATVRVAKKRANDLFDPWVEKEPELIKPEESFLPKKVELKEPKTLKIPPVVLTKTKKRLPAVKIPNAGISYNPEFSQWEELLRKEGERAVEEERKRLKDEQAEMERLARITQEEIESSDEEGEEGNEDDEALVPEEDNLFQKLQPRRKTQAQRNKAKKQKEEERKHAMQKLEKKKLQQLEELKQITKTITKKENATLEKLGKEAEEAEEAEEAGMADETDTFKLRKKKFGKQRLPRAPLELQLPDELADSLRKLKPEGNHLRERFRSLMERGIVEVRVPVTRKKVRRITTEKWSYKNFQ